MPTVNKVIRPWMKKGKVSESRWSKERPNGLPESFYRNAPWRKLRKRQLEKQPLWE